LKSKLLDVNATEFLKSCYTLSQYFFPDHSQRNVTRIAPAHPAAVLDQGFPGVHFINDQFWPKSFGQIFVPTFDFVRIIIQKLI
jgi:hypothetical protein